tara:strand:- start:208 stop:495 length:288 start_codon:yes stop_codon:yes gene_type:complete
MRTEAELKNTIQKAQRADELLNDPLIQEFIISVRGDLLNKFESTSLSSEAERMSAWNQSQVFNAFVEKFTKTIKEGKNAKLTLMERAGAQLKSII